MFCQRTNIVKRKTSLIRKRKEEKMAEILVPYPHWKKIVWRFVRVFIASFIAGGSVVLTAASEVAFTSFENFLRILVVPFCLAGATAGINSLGKLARDYFGSEDKDSFVDKIII
jgi:hypothetical protein